MGEPASTIPHARAHVLTSSGPPMIMDLLCRLEPRLRSTDTTGGSPCCAASSAGPHPAPLWRGGSAACSSPATLPKCRHSHSCWKGGAQCPGPFLDQIWTKQASIPIEQSIKQDTIEDRNHQDANHRPPSTSLIFRHVSEYTREALAMSLIWGWPQIVVLQPPGAAKPAISPIPLGILMGRIRYTAVRYGVRKGVLCEKHEASVCRRGNPGRETSSKQFSKLPINGRRITFRSRQERQTRSWHVPSRSSLLCPLGIWT